MAFPYIQGFGGMPISTTVATVTAALARRGIQTPGTSGITTVAAGGKTWLRVLNNWAIEFARWGATSSFWLGMRISGAAGTNVTQHGYLAGNVSPLYIALLNTGALRLYKDTSGTANDINLSLTVGSEVFVELHINGTTLSVYLNGEATPSATATVAAPLEYASYIADGDTGSNGQQFTDFYVNSTRLGDGSARLLATTTVSSNTGTVTGAANAEEALGDYDTDAKYVTYAAGQKSILNQAGILDNPLTISCVQVTALGKKTGTALQPEQVKLVTGSENTLLTVALSLANTGHNVSTTVDPHDSAAWTKAKINAMQVGVGSA